MDLAVIINKANNMAREDMGVVKTEKAWDQNSAKEAAHKILTKVTTKSTIRMRTLPNGGRTKMKWF